jgi:hypothetical protein
MAGKAFRRFRPAWAGVLIGGQPSAGRRGGLLQGLRGGRMACGTWRCRERSGHALHSAIGPGVRGCGQPMGDGVGRTDPCNGVCAGLGHRRTVGHGRPGAVSTGRGLSGTAARGGRRASGGAGALARPPGPHPAVAAPAGEPSRAAPRPPARAPGQAAGSAPAAPPGQRPVSAMWRWSRGGGQPVLAASLACLDAAVSPGAAPLSCGRGRGGAGPDGRP